MSKPVDSEAFASVVRKLLSLIINARKEVEIVHRLLALGSPLPRATTEEVRRQVEAEIEPVIQSIAEMPADTLTEFLQRYEGTIQ